MGKGCAIGFGQRGRVNTLKFGLEQCYTGFLRLLSQPLPVQLCNFAEIIADLNIVIQRHDFILLAVGAHIALIRGSVHILSQYHLLIANVKRLDDLIITRHAFIHKDLLNSLVHI